MAYLSTAGGESSARLGEGAENVAATTSTGSCLHDTIGGCLTDEARGEPP